MNLPHQDPLVFAKEVIVLTKESATVLCEFNEIPTLPMFIEAGAQASCAFESGHEPKIGFLTKAKNVELLNDIKDKSFIIKLKIEAEVETMKQFYFEAYEKKSNTKTVSGWFTILIQ